jgi:protein-L-isoaspartate(D-aspartate) O-methyltransferase
MGLSTSQQRHHRLAMVEEQLRPRGIRNEDVLSAMEEVPRHLFIPEDRLDEAYADRPCPIGHGQTISQPYMVATMTEHLALQPNHRVLEIGTGCGYQTAILARLTRQVCTIEVISELSRQAQMVLGDLDVANVNFHIGDGHDGWPRQDTFDRIMITAAADEVPVKLFDQLADGGLLMAPVARQAEHHRLMLYEKRGDCIEGTFLCYCTFVPLVRSEK